MVSPSNHPVARALRHKNCRSNIGDFFAKLSRQAPRPAMRGGATYRQAKAFRYNGTMKSPDGRFEQFDFKRERYDKKILVDAEGVAKIEPAGERDKEYIKAIQQIENNTELSEEQKMELARKAQARWRESGTNRDRFELPTLNSPLARRIREELEAEEKKH